MVSDRDGANTRLLDLCLNPCSNGIWSLTVTKASDVNPIMCLNPCSNGIWSLTGRLGSYKYMNIES